jgi:predicted NodU family carbamoyl transferase
MDILGYKSGGHDGTLCYLQDGRLVFNIEAEKDSNPRHALFRDEQVAAILERWKCRPQLACGDSLEFGSAIPDNYLGFEPDSIRRSKNGAGVAGNAPYISVPHELAHIACSYALSDLPDGQPFYALVWEGYIGRFYHVDADFRVTKLGDAKHVMDFVGVRYSFPYHATGRSDFFGHSAAGKIMALAGFASAARAASPEVRELVDYLLDSKLQHGSGRVSLNGDFKALYERFERFRERPVTDAEFLAICKALQDGVFERFRRFAENNLDHKLPLLISGGCGLNCDWNTMWRDSNLFPEVFVPPVTNDCGIAIGAAAVVQRLETGKIKIKWDVYAGEEFVDEPVDFAAEGFEELDLEYGQLTEWLVRWELIVPWIQGRYEMGARALTHRSLLAAPFADGARNELNRIKKREHFRPVAPVCMEEEVSRYFEWNGPSPYMLYFQKVKVPELRAITHYDGTARVQTVSRAQDPATYDLLHAFRAKTGYGVLCNTSLNFLGRGFINRTRDIVRYVKETGIHAFVINRKMYLSHEKRADIELRKDW